MRHQSEWRALGLIVMGTLMGLLLQLPGWAQSLPESFKHALTQWDPQLEFKQDSWVKTARGEEYIVAFSALPPVASGDAPIRVTQTWPAASDVPDLVEFSDGHYLIHVVRLPNGRQTLPLLADLPAGLRAATFSQNLFLPPGFLVPTAWKSLTGDLLVPSEMADTPNFPLAVLDTTRRHILFWDTHTGTSQRQFNLPCEGSSLATSSDAQTIWIGCRNEAALMRLDVASGALTRYELPDPVHKLALDSKTQQLWIALAIKARELPALPSLVPGQKRTNTVLAPALTRWSLVTLPTDNPVDGQNKLRLGMVFTDEPLSDIQISPFRRRLYALSGDGNELLMAHLDHHSLEKIIPMPVPMTELTVQNEKMLWMASAKTNQLLGFDLRWQEFTNLMDLPASPASIAADQQQLYVLLPEINTVYPIDTKTLTPLNPIMLPEDSAPSQLVLDWFARQAFVVSLEKPGIHVVNLERRQWVGTQGAREAAAGPAQWLIPQAAIPDQRLKIKFEDGRLLIQKKPALQSVK